MGVLFKGVTQILSEACQSDTVYLNEMNNELQDELMSEIDELDELNCDLHYTVEMVNVLEQETKYGRRYLVEYENLVKLMENSQLGIKESLDLVCEHNMIGIQDTYVVIESQDVLEESISETTDSISETSNPLSKANRRNKLAKCNKAIKDMKNKGIKILKKKSKKNNNYLLGL